jgi:hypothetical protein
MKKLNRGARYTMRRLPPTKPQLAILVRLGYSGAVANRLDAHDLIERLLADRRRRP